LSSEELGELGS